MSGRLSQQSKSGIRPSSSLSADFPDALPRRPSISSLAPGEPATGFAASLVRRLSGVVALDRDKTPTNSGAVAGPSGESQGGKTKTTITVTKVNGEVKRGTSTSSSEDDSSDDPSDAEICANCGSAKCSCDEEFHGNRGKSSGCFQFFMSFFDLAPIFSFIGKKSAGESEEKEEVDIEMLSNTRGITDTESETDITEDELLSAPPREQSPPLPPPVRRESVIDKMMDQISVITRRVTPTADIVRSVSPVPPSTLPATPEEGRFRKGEEDVTESDYTPNGTPKLKKKGLKNKLTKKLSNKSLKRMGSLKRSEKNKK